MKLIIFTFILSFILSTKAVILDTDGDELKPNTEYCILPSATVYAGGLNLGNKNSSCAENVAQANSPTENGLPVNFITVNPNSITIALNEDVNIAFSGPTTCNSSTVWTLFSDADTGKRFVKIGGVLGNPGIDTLGSWFSIQEYVNGLYKIVYCPTVCETCRPACGYLGIVCDDDGGRWLAITDEPCAWAFTKA